MQPPERVFVDLRVARTFETEDFSDPATDTVAVEYTRTDLVQALVNAKVQAAAQEAFAAGIQTENEAERVVQLSSAIALTGDPDVGTEETREMFALTSYGRIFVWRASVQTWVEFRLPDLNVDAGEIPDPDFGEGFEATEP